MDFRKTAVVYPSPPLPQLERAPKAEAKPLRILFSSYRSDRFCGGQGVYLRLATAALANQGHHVDVISGPPYPDLDPRVRLIKLPSLDLYEKERSFFGMPPPPFGDMHSWTDVYEYFAHISGDFPEPYTFGNRLVAFLRDHHAEYDILHDNQTLTYGLLKVQEMGLPVVGMIHHPITHDRRIALKATKSITLNLLIRRWYSFLRMQKKVAKQLKPVIVVSKTTEKDVIEDFRLPAENLHLVYHGIDHHTWRPNPQIPRETNRLIVVASADVPLKGLIYFLEAFATLRKDHPNLKSTIIGKLREGPTAKRIEALKIESDVEFVEQLTNEEIVDLYAQATIAVTPSVYEGFGFPAGEAMACGVPVVATTGGALPEVVGDAGLTVPPKNAAALAQAIDRLLRDPALRADLGERGKERILEKFTWENAATNMVDLYRDVIKSHADN